jgi:hypothetical protein
MSVHAASGTFGYSTSWLVGSACLGSDIHTRVWRLCVIRAPLPTISLYASSGNTGVAAAPSPTRPGTSTCSIFLSSSNLTVWSRLVRRLYGNPRNTVNNSRSRANLAVTGARVMGPCSHLGQGPIMHLLRSCGKTQSESAFSQPASRSPAVRRRRCLRTRETGRAAVRSLGISCGNSGRLLIRISPPNPPKPALRSRRAFQCEP